MFGLLQTENWRVTPIETQPIKGLQLRVGFRRSESDKALESLSILCLLHLNLGHANGRFRYARVNFSGVVRICYHQGSGVDGQEGPCGAVITVQDENPIINPHLTRFCMRVEMP